MEISNNGIVILNRGDTFETPLYLYQNNIASFIKRCDLTPVESIENSTIYFGITEPGSKFEDALIRKEYTYEDFITEESDSYIIVNLRPEETEYLLPGRYYYEIKIEIITNNGATRKVYTITPKTIFFIVE